MIKNHQKLERNSILLLVVTLVTVTIGGIAEIVPMFRMEQVIEPVKGMRPYSPLELAGQQIYIREGCYNCHSQQIRVLRDEVERYGHYSLAAESMYDHPFQWGSKRTGPDLARVGGKYSDEWHVAHMADPRSVVPESIMPRYGFLSKETVDGVQVQAWMKTLNIVGVPYTEEQIAKAPEDVKAQANAETDVAAFQTRYSKANVRDFDGQPGDPTEMDALVAYLQVLGTMVDFKDYRPDLKPAGN